jgi:tripartite-type tricarboxylate transporter receptor subunit TctC
MPHTPARPVQRRAFVTGVTAIAATLAAPAIVRAQTTSGGAWPNRLVKLILPYPPGGSTDLIGRPWADLLSQAFGQPFIIENRGGAGGAIGTDAAAKAAPDGYTFLATANNTLTILPQLRPVPYDPIASFTPVARLGELICGFTVNPTLGLKTFKEMVAYAKANPGKLAYGSAGLGTATHMRLEMLKARAGIDIQHVPYKGSGDALTSLLGNTVQMMNEVNVIPHVKGGRLTLLNINHDRRHPDFPNAPTLIEEGFPGADVPIWFALMAPAGTPAEIVNRLNAKISELAETSDIKARLGQLNVVVTTQKTAELTAYLAEDTARNTALIKSANITME